MIDHARLVLARSVLVAAALVAVALPAHAQGSSDLDPFGSAAGLDRSQSRAFGSIFTTTFADGDGAQQPPQQNQRHEGVGVGIKVGPLFNKFTSDIATLNFDGKTGLMGGVFFGGNRPGVVGVMGELMYAKKSSNTPSGEAELYYLEIPVLLRVNVGSNSLNGVLVYGLLGPVFDINLKSRLNGVDVKDQFEDFDIGIIAGGGLEITRFIIEGRYNWGLRNILVGNLFNSNNIKTQSFALLFGFRFN